MESANLHPQHHQLQGQLVIPSSSLLTSPSIYGATATASPHAWTQNFTLSSSGSAEAAGNLNIQNCNGVLNLNQRQKNERIVSAPLNNSMIHQDLSFHWNQSSSHHHHELQQLSRSIKQELSSSDSFPKFTDMLNTTSSSSIDQEDPSSPTSCYIKDDQKDLMSDNLLHKTISSGFPINAHHQFSPPQVFSSFGSSIPSRGNFSQIYPSINISNLNRSPPTSISLSNSFDINLQALDLLTSTRFSSSFGHPSHHNDNLAIYNGLDRVRQSTHVQPSSPSKVSSFTTNDLTEAKRPNNSLMEPQATQAAPKKSRLVSRASCPPFKVRKEKLGDRIAALQQLVAPFGKTDTASVLMEAIGYIKFLQNQVETLSVPYMKSSRNKTSTRTSQATQFQGSTVEEGNEEAKKDLRSRGLCLVPLSCMSYVTGDGNGGTGSGGIWPLPTFGGGT